MNNQYPNKYITAAIGVMALLFIIAMVRAALS
jgi:hypothetical protein